jgi:hypothetical protein
LSRSLTCKRLIIRRAEVADGNGIIAAILRLDAARVAAPG